MGGPPFNRYGCLSALGACAATILAASSSLFRMFLHPLFSLRLSRIELRALLGRKDVANLGLLLLADGEHPLANFGA